MRKKLNPAKSGVDFQHLIVPHCLTGHHVVIINSVELNILIGGRKMKSAFTLVAAMMIFASGCRREATIDASSPEQFWLSVRSITAQLTRDEDADFQFAIVKLRKQGYSEDQLAQMSAPPLDASFLRSVDKRTAQEVIALAKQLPEVTPPPPPKSR